MGILFSNRLPRICSTHDDMCARVLLLGLDSSGKSTLLARFKNLVDQQHDQTTPFIEHIRTEPTFVYQVETIYRRLTPLGLNIWDLGGEERTRDLWRFYLTGIHGTRKWNFHRSNLDDDDAHSGIVFVIDSEDTARLLVAREELLNLAELLDDGSNIPIIIAANKQDLRGQLRTQILFPSKRIAWPTFSFYSDALSKEELIDALQLPKIDTGEWKCFETSAQTGKYHLNKVFPSALWRP